MFTKQAPSHKESALDKLIYESIRELDGFSAESPEFDRITKQIEKLNKFKDPRPEPISRTALLGALTNIGGIALILRHEQFNVITSKALGFIMKTPQP